jgi:spore germination protein YaaH
MNGLLRRFAGGAVALILLAIISPSVTNAVASSAVPKSRVADMTAPPIMSLADQQSAGPASSMALAPFGHTTALREMASVSAGFSSNPNLQREVFGFVNAGNLGDPYVGYSTWDLSLLSTVAYFGLHVNSGDGNLITTDTAWAVYHSATMSSFINAAHTHHVRVIVSINLHDFSTSSTNQTCVGLQSSSAQNTIQQAVAQMEWANIDGININYEGTITTCADGLTNRQELVSFAQNLRAAMPAGTYLSIDTFSGSAEDNQEFFDIAGLQPYVDSFFVMAYDMDEANYFEAPLNCTSYCFNPVSPLNSYRFNVTKSMTQYTALVPASKVILGQPYYGRRGCVALLSTAHQYRIPNTNFATPTYIYASTIPSQTGVYAFAGRRDPLDGVSEWDTWYDTDWSCNREQYFDDVYSLGAKYNVVIQDNLRGVGLFSLDYGGGSPELWSLLNTYFSCVVSLSLTASQSSTEFTFGLGAGSCSVTRFDVRAFDFTLNEGWFNLPPVSAVAGSGNAIVDGYPGHTYEYQARAHAASGVVGAWSAISSTTVDVAATNSHPFSGLYTLDEYGGVNPADSPPLAGTAYWRNWNIARAAHAVPGTADSGFVLDGWGGLHSYGAPGLTETSGASGHYWSGWDIARDFAFLPDGTGGFVLDGWGGLHPFRVNGNTAPLTAVGFAYWSGWDIARKVVIFADGKGGYTLDAWGGIHPFGINGPAPLKESAIAKTGYWPGWSIARDIVLVPGDGGHSGYTLDGWGGVHPFHVNGDGSVMPANISTAYWSGWDIARGMFLLPGSASAGYTLDGWGGLHPFGGAPPIVSQSYWPGRDIAKCVFGA